MAASSDIAPILKKAAEKRKALQAQVQEKLEAIAAAQAEMNALLQAIDRIRLTVKELQELNGSAGEADDNTEKQPRLRERADTGLTKAGWGNKQAFFEQVAREAILKYGKPLGTKEVLQAFQELGHRIEGTDPWKQASNNLWKAKREGRFIHRIGLGYWPADIPNTAIQYVPPPEGITPLEIKRLKPKRSYYKPTGRPWRRPRVLTPEQVETAERWRAEGKTLKQITEGLGDVSLSTVARRLSETSPKATRGKGRRKSK